MCAPSKRVFEDDCESEDEEDNSLLVQSCTELLEALSQCEHSLIQVVKELSPPAEWGDEEWDIVSEEFGQIIWRAVLERLDLNSQLSRAERILLKSLVQSMVDSSLEEIIAGL